MDLSTDKVIITEEGIDINGKNGWYQVANFGLQLLYRIVDHHDEVIWQAVIEQQPEGGEKITQYLEFTNDELATPARFHTVLLKHGFVFRGSSYELNILKELLVAEAQHAEAITTLGFHADSELYFYANGAFDHDTGKFYEPDEKNILDLKQGTFFLPYRANLHLKHYRMISRHQFLLCQNAPCFDVWTSCFAKAYGQEGVIPLCFTIASLFRDIAFKNVHFFPLLYERGPKGTGKSAMARSLTALTGRPQQEINLLAPNTAKSLPRLLEQVHNGLVWFDEYQNDLPSDIRALLQAVYDGGGYQRALKDQSSLTSSVDILSSVILTSNHTPDYDVFLSRCLVCTFNAHERPAEQVQAFEKLIKWESGNLSQLSGELLHYRRLIHTHWESIYTRIYQYIRSTTKNVSARTISNMSVLMTPAIILEEHGKIHLKAAYELTDLQEFARQACLIQEGILTGRSDLHVFFEVLSMGVNTGRLQPDVEYTYFKPKHKDANLCLALRLARLMPFYLKEYRALYNKIGLRRDEIEDLLKNVPGYLGEHSTRFLTGKGHKVPYNVPVFRHIDMMQQFGVQWEHPIFSRKF